MNSGMNYGGMESLIKEVNTINTKMQSIINGLIENVPSTLAGGYQGSAADATKARLISISNNINTTMQSIIDKLVASAEQQQAAYATQEKKMQQSVVETLPGNGGR